MQSAPATHLPVLVGVSSAAIILKHGTLKYANLLYMYGHRISMNEHVPFGFLLSYLLLNVVNSNCTIKVETIRIDEIAFQIILQLY